MDICLPKKAFQPSCLISGRYQRLQIKEYYSCSIPEFNESYESLEAGCKGLETCRCGQETVRNMR